MQMLQYFYIIEHLENCLDLPLTFSFGVSAISISSSLCMLATVSGDELLDVLVDNVLPVREGAFEALNIAVVTGGADADLCIALSVVLCSFALGNISGADNNLGKEEKRVFVRSARSGVNNIAGLFKSNDKSDGRGELFSIL